MADSKSRYWWAILWLENIRPDWQEVLDGIIQNPYCYCIHDKDLDELSEGRKPHVHLIIAYSGPTTYKSIMQIYHEFDKDPNHPCVNKAERIKNIRYAFNYLIHDTDDCRKKGKYQYSPSERVGGLNFDIGLFEQLSLDEKHEMVNELSFEIFHLRITNYLDFYTYVASNYDSRYLQVVLGYSGHFDRLTRGCYLKLKAEEEKI